MLSTPLLIYGANGYTGALIARLAGKVQDAGKDDEEAVEPEQAAEGK